MKSEVKKIYKKYIFMLKQHIGTPNKPLVKIGDKVRKGQLIAVPTELGTNIHSSINGFVMDVAEDRIEIVQDEIQSDVCMPIKQKNDILEAIKEAGIVGMGGAGFPTYIKMKTDLKGGYVIANGIECEPLLNHNAKQMEENPEIIYRGLKYAMEATNASKGYIALKAKNKKAINSIKSVVDESRIEVKILPDLYPMGEERVLIREILGEFLEPNQLPSDANAVVLNVETLSRICEAVEQKRPVISKNLTVIGKLKTDRKAHALMNVPIGTAIKDIIEDVGGIDGKYGEIIMGGPFMGKSARIDDVVTKTTNGIIVTIPFPKERRKAGILVCACGGSEERLREIAEKMGTPIVAVEFCKQVKDVKGKIKCEKPGICPGQAEKVLKLKKSGAEVLIIGTCSDCTNTIMGIAPKLHLSVYHHTDHVMQTVGYPLLRRLMI